MSVVKKGKRMKHYTITLINKNHSLDLTQKRQEIEEVFELLDNGGKTGNSFEDLHRCQTLQIQRDSIEAQVEESGKSWHRWVGRILANDYGLREYCHGRNKRHMFKWN